MDSSLYKNTPVALTLCMLVLVPVVALMGLGLKAVESEKVARQYHRQSAVELQLKEVESQLQSALIDARKQVQAKMLAAANDVRELRELIYLSDPVELVTVWSLHKGMDAVRVFPPEAMAGIVTEQQLLNRYREEVESLQSLLPKSNLSQSNLNDLIQNVESNQGQTILNCWNTENLQLCVVFSRRWVINTLHRALLTVTEAEAEVKEGQSELTLLDLSLHSPAQQYGAVKPLNSSTKESEKLSYIQQYRLSFPLSQWQLRFKSSAQSTLGQQMIIYASMILPVVFIMFAMAFWLYRQQRNAQKEVAGKIAFAAELSHELRTPLANMRLYITLMQKQLKSERLNNYCNIIDSEAERLGGLVDNAMLLARPKRNDQPNFKQIIPNHQIDNILNSLAPLIIQSGNCFSTDLRTHEPVIVDAVALERVLVNLIDNSCKYAPNTLITIKSWQVDGVLYIQVADRGKGIDADLLPDLFTPYQASKDRKDGFGLGLAVCHRLMSRGKGEITLLPCSHDEGLGASFLLRFVILDCKKPSKISPGIAAEECYENSIS